MFLFVRKKCFWNFLKWSDQLYLVNFLALPVTYLQVCENMFLFYSNKKMKELFFWKRCMFIINITLSYDNISTSNCDVCQTECFNDPNCWAVTCSDTQDGSVAHCTWWKNGVCELNVAKHDNSPYQMCRQTGIVFFFFQ